MNTDNDKLAKLAAAYPKLPGIVDNAASPFDWYSRKRVDVIVNLAADLLAQKTQAEQERDEAREVGKNYSVMFDNAALARELAERQVDALEAREAELRGLCRDLTTALENRNREKTALEQRIAAVNEVLADGCEGPCAYGSCAECDCGKYEPCNINGDEDKFCVRCLIQKRMALAAADDAQVKGEKV